MLESLVSLLRRSPCEGEDQDHPLELRVVPGLITLLDVALYRSVEAELTATVAAGNALVCAWLDVKRQAQVLLSTAQYDEHEHIAASSSTPHVSFARACLESAMDALEKLSTDPLAASANLTDPFESVPSNFSTASSHTTPLAISNIDQGVAVGSSETGRRAPLLLQRPRDCWETARLICCDHVWADEALQACQRHVRHLSKQPFMTATTDNTVDDMRDAATKRDAHNLVLLVQYDLPMRLHHFRAAIASNSVVTKRLYLVKCEYRAPFRAFLEAHQAVQRSPSLESVQEFLQLQNNYNKLTRRRSQAESNLQSLLETPELVEALSLEEDCETIEVGMGQALFPFTELARTLDHRRAILRAIPGVLEPGDVGVLLETLRRLKYLLARKSGSETSSGIRPLLLDLQGIPRDETPYDPSQASAPVIKRSDDDDCDERIIAILGRLNELVRQLRLLGKLCATRGAFGVDSKRGEVDLPSNIAKPCTCFDHELFAAQCEDWFALVKRQRELVSDFRDISERIRRAELEMSISRASESNLGVVRLRLDMIARDRQKRFDVLKEIIEEVCLREMNLHVKLVAPRKAIVLELPSTSAVGVFGTPLVMAGEKLPLG